MSGENVSMDSGRISIRMDSGGVAFSGCLSLAVLGNISMDGGNVSWRRVWVSFVDVSGVVCDGRESVYGGFYVSEVSAFSDRGY
jgi:hypothetical protein